MPVTGREFTEANFDKLGGAFWHHLSEGGLNEKNHRSQILATLFAGLLVLYGGVEFSKLLFRSKFGLEALDYRKVAVAAVGTMTISVLCFLEYMSTSTNGIALGYESNFSFLVTATAYFFFTVYMIYRYVKERKLSKSFFALDRNYRGDSTILEFLIKDGWKASTVQNLAEPLLLTSIGVFLLQWNLYLGFPLIVFGLSCWIHLLVESVVGSKHLRDLLSNEGYKHSQESPFVEVVN